MKTLFRSRRNPRGMAALLAMTLGLGIVLQVSAPPSGAIPITSPGSFFVTYGRRSPTDIETNASWPSGFVEITRTSRGNYTLFAASLSGAGNAQLTVLGPGAPLPLCSVTRTTVSSSGTTLKVRCWSATTGKTADAGFSLFYNSDRSLSAGRHYAVLTTSKSNRSHTPSKQFRAEPGAAPLTVTRLARGAYKVTFPAEDFPNNGGILFVSAAGTSPRYCNLAGWWGTPVTAWVNCYSRSGSPADSLFSLLATEGNLGGYVSPGPFLSVFRPSYSTGNFGYDWHFTGAGGTDTSRNEFQPGRSTVVGGNLAGGGSLFAIVSTYGLPTANRCAPGVIRVDSPDVVFEVQCFTPAGYPTGDASYTLGALMP